MLCVWAAHAEIHASSSRRALYIAFLGIVTVGGLVTCGGPTAASRIARVSSATSFPGPTRVDTFRTPCGETMDSCSARAQEGRFLPRRPVRPPSRDRLQRARHRRTDGPRLHGSRSAGGVAHRRPRRPVGASAGARRSLFVRPSSRLLTVDRISRVSFRRVRLPGALQVGPLNARNLRGTILFALGLATRMGPLFVVATTVVFFAVRRQWTRALVVAGAWSVVLAGDAWLLSLIREPGVTMGDYGPILYGMIHGEDFTFIAAVHPELSLLPVAQRGPAIVAIVLSEIRRQPALAIVGPARSIASFLFMPHGLLSFVLYNPDDIFLESPLPVRELRPRDDPECRGLPRGELCGDAARGNRFCHRLYLLIGSARLPSVVGPQSAVLRNGVARRRGFVGIHSAVDHRR